MAPLSHAQMLLSGTFLQARKKVHKHRRICFADILQVCGPVVGTYDKYMLHMVQHIFLKTVDFYKYKFSFEYMNICTSKEHMHF